MKYHDAKQIRTSKAFKEFVVAAYKQGKTMQDIAKAASLHFHLPISKNYISLTLYRQGARQPQPQRNFTKPVSPYDYELGNL